MIASGATIGLDLSLTGTGIAIVYPNGVRFVTVVKTNGLRGSERLDRIVQTIRNNVDAVQRAAGIADVHLEGPSYGSQKRGQRGFFERGGLHWMVKHALWSLNVDFDEVPPGTLKLWATGHGDCDKPAMVAAARDRGYEGTDDNEADALLLALRAIAIREGAVA